MKSQEIVAKLWGLCNDLRDDGITYHQYVNELTYLLFLKLAKATKNTVGIPEKYRWESLVQKDGLDRMNHYKTLLTALGTSEAGVFVQEIFKNASTAIKEPETLSNLVSAIDKIDWHGMENDNSSNDESEENDESEVFGDLYEGLLEKNAGEVKSGAGQYFTPRPLIDVAVRLISPQVGERCNDPACGTFGFMIAANKYIQDHNDEFELSIEQLSFQKSEAFSGCELVPDTHRLALMNALLHKIRGKIILGDSLSADGAHMKNYDVVLTNPPFGSKKKGSGRAIRDEFSFKTSNKQLVFLQHIYRSLKKGGRAAVVLPDNVLFVDGVGQNIRQELMDKCNLHTVLRLPTGIFYAQGVKTNVLFFTRGDTDKDNTKTVWFYDLRSNMPSFGKTNPLKVSHFKEFEAAYTAPDRSTVNNPRWQSFTRQQIKDYNDNLDLGLLVEENETIEEMVNPLDTAEACIEQLSEAAILMQSVADELRKLTGAAEA